MTIITMYSSLALIIEIIGAISTGIYLSPEGLLDGLDVVFILIGSSTIWFSLLALLMLLLEVL